MPANLALALYPESGCLTRMHFHFKKGSLCSEGLWGNQEGGRVQESFWTKKMGQGSFTGIRQKQEQDLKGRSGGGGDAYLCQATL